MPLIRLRDCVIPNPDPQNPTPDFDPQKLTEVESRVIRLANLVNNAATKAPNNVLARQQLWQNMIRMSELAPSHALSPKRANNFAMFMVRNLGMVNHALGFGDEYSSLGWARASQIKARRVNQATFNRMLREAGTAERMSRAWSEFRDILTKSGITARQDVRYIAAQVQELGWFPYIKPTAGSNAVAGMRMNEKYQLFRNELKNRWNLADVTVDRLLELGAESSRVYHDIGDIAERVGVNLDTVEQLGYFPRIMSDEARKLLNWKWKDMRNGVLENVNGDRVTVSAAMMKSRTTYEFLVEDEIVLDYVLRNFSQQVYNDPGELYRLATGIQGAGVADIIDSHRGLTETFRQMIDARPDLLNALIDNGILSKAPFTSVEVVDYLVKSMRLPFEGLADVFESDWVRGLRLYTEQLEELTRQSGQVQLIVRNAIAGDWAVNSAMRVSNPGTYDNWIPLVSDDPTRPSVFTPEMLDRYMFTQGSVRGDKVLNQLYDSYVHPDVANLIKSTMQISNSPGALAIIARGFQQMNRIFGSLALVDPTYIPRQLISAYFQLGAGGGDLNRLAPDLTRMVLYQLGGGEEVLDNTRRIYANNTLTERELFQRAQDLGYIDRFEPLTGTQTDPKKYHAWNPLSVRRNMRYVQYVIEQQGVAGGVAEVARSFGEASDRASYVSRWANNVIDNAGRFAALKSSLSRSPREFTLPDLVRFLTSGGTNKHSTVEEAIEHWQHYFFFFDDQTPFDRFARHFVPFWGFWGKMMPSALRHVIRHPTRFVAYQRLYSILHGNEYESGDFTESSVPTWLQHASPIYIRTPDGRGGFEHHAIPMEPLDPYQAALNLLGDLSSAAGSVLGIENHNRSTAEKLGDRPWARSQTSSAAETLLDLTWPIYRSIASEFAGRDLSTNRDLDGGTAPTSFVGYEMTPRTRMWLSSILPVLNSVNSYNPFGIFGSRERRDSRTGIVTPPTGSQMPFSGGAARSDMDNFNTDNRYGAYRWVGVKIYPVDIALNAGTTYDQLRIDINEGRKYIQSLREQALSLPPDSDQRQGYIDKANEVEYIIEETRLQLDALEAWANQRGISVTEAAVRLRSYNRAIGDLPRPRR